jgi:CRP-like cAMP-binding protein
MDKMITYYMNFPLFEDMSKELIFTIVTRSRYLKISTKETVVQQGDMPRLVYFIKSGKLKVVKEIKTKVEKKSKYKKKFTTLDTKSKINFED